MMPLSLIDFRYLLRAAGPELPMQVVQPKPIRLKSDLVEIELQVRNWRDIPQTTWLPGASEVLTQGFCIKALGGGVARQKSRRRSARSDWEVLVHEVIAAITTSPCPRIENCDSPPGSASTAFRAFLVFAGHRRGKNLPRTAGKRDPGLPGRFGPAHRGAPRRRDRAVQGLGEHRIGRLGGAEQPLRLSHRRATSATPCRRARPEVFR